MADANSRVWMPFTQMQTAPPPLMVRSGKGAILQLEDGRSLVDCISSWWVTLHGHGQPEIARAVAEQAERLEHVIAAGFTHQPAEDLADRLVALLPDSLRRIFYSDDGSTAVEVALKVAVQYWHNQGLQRHRFISFSGSYHGDTVGAMSVGQRSPFNQAFEGLLFPVDTVDYPATHWDDEDIEEREARSLGQLRRLLDAGAADYAAVIIEPLVQGAGGMRMCTERFLRQVQAVVRERDVLIIYDEVLVAFGRVGAMFACEKAGTEPDLVCLAKGLTGGFLPMAATACSETVYAGFCSDDPAATFHHGHSYTANPLGCAAALASLELLETSRDLLTRIESHHRSAMVKLGCEPTVARRRVCGTIAALDLEIGGAAGYSNPLAPVLRQRFLDRGFLLRPLGNTVYLIPPYCIEPAQLDAAYSCIREVATELSATNR